MSNVTVVRIYLTEGERLFKDLVKRLHDDEKVAGMTAIRGVMGFGRSGNIHSSRLLDLSLNLPVVIEFFDNPERVREIMARLNDLVPPGHILSWSAEFNDGE